MLTKDRAICIRTTDYSETSQIVTLFARQAGKVRAIAKGSRRPKSAFDGPIEVLSSGEIVFSDPHRESLATLTEFQQQPVPAGVRRHLFVLHSALFAAELLDSMTDDFDPHPALFDQFIQFLEDMKDEELTRQRRDVLIRLILFQVVLLREAGLYPVLNTCANCKRALADDWRDVYFSHAANGLICRDCEMSFPDRSRIDMKVARSLADLRQMADADEVTLDAVERMLVHHFTSILGRRLRMAEYVVKG